MLDRFNYWFENLLLHGTWARVGLLFGLVIILTLLFVPLIAITSESATETSDALWQSMLHMLDRGVLKADSGNSLYLVVMLVETIFGLLVAGTLISILNSGVSDFVHGIAGGRAKVMEKRPHIVILGFNDLSLTIVDKLARLSATERGTTPIVVMDDDQEVVDMAAQIDETGVNRRRAHVICRKGDICDYDDLDICSLEDAKTVIVCGRDDFETVQSLMACNARLNQLERHRTLNMAAVIRNDANEMEARFAGPDGTHIICYDRIVSKVIAESSFDPSISYVYLDLLNSTNNALECLDKDELLPSDGPLATGAVDAMHINRYFAGCVTIGGTPTRHGTHASDEEQIFSPDERRTVQDYSRFFVIGSRSRATRTLAEDALPQIDETLFSSNPTHDERDVSRILILGGGRLLEDVLQYENKHYVGEGRATVTVATHKSSSVLPPDCQVRWPSLDITLQRCDTRSFEPLRELVESTQAQSVVVLSDHTLKVRKADERTLSQLVYLQRIREREGSANSSFKIASEINLENTRKIVRMVGADDYVVGNTLVALFVSCMAREWLLGDLLNELLSSRGASISMRPVSEFLDFGGASQLECDLYTVGEAVAEKGGILIGLHQLATDAPGEESTYERPVLNPARWASREAAEPQRYTLRDGDELVVISGSS